MYTFDTVFQDFSHGLIHFIRNFSLKEHVEAFDWLLENFNHTRREKNVLKLRYGLCLQIFQASWAKNYDLLRVIAVHGTMTIEFYVEF